MEKSFTDSKRGLFLIIVLFLSFVIPLVSTAVIYTVSKNGINDKSKKEFSSRADLQERAVQRRITRYVTVLKGTAGLFSGSEKVTKSEFETYVEEVDPKESIPGALGIGFIANVPVDELEDFIKTQEADRKSEFKVRPVPSVENEFFIITFIEPEEINARTIGFNMAFEPNRRKAAIESRDLDLPQITNSVELLQDENKKAGFLIFLPVYKADMPVATKEERLAAFEGWVYSPLFASDFFGALIQEEEFVSFEATVSETDSELNENEIYSNLSRPMEEPKFKEQRKISFLGQTWNATYVSSPEFEDNIDYSEADAFLFGGLALTLISVLLGIVIFRRSQYVEKEVEEKTRELVERDERFSRVVAGANTGIWDWMDLSRDELYWSPQFLNLIGYEEGEIEQSGKVFREKLIHPDDMPVSIAAFERSLATGERYETEYRLKTKEGVYKWFLVNGIITVDPNTGVQRVSGSISDIDDLRKTREDLKISKERLSLAIEGSKIGLFDLNDVDSDDGYLSEQTYALLGYSKKELEPKVSSFTNLVHREDKKRSVSQVFRAIKNISEFGFECRMKHKNGTYLWVEAKGAVTINPQNGKKRITGSIHDISERKEVEKLKNEFVSTVSHELRTPLTSIKGSLGLLSGTMLDELSSEARALVEIANRNSERLGVLVNDILDMEKLTSGKLEFFIDTIEIGPIVEKSVDSIEAIAQVNNIAIQVKKIDENLRVDADPERLSQVLHNLLSNAIKFSDDGEKVEVYVLRSEDSIRICVEDNGSGVPEEFRSKIFGQFSQSDSSSTRAQGGSGLGLYISQKFMDRMNGKIGFDPKETGGTIFWIEFLLSNGIKHKRVHADE